MITAYPESSGNHPRQPSRMYLDDKPSSASPVTLPPRRREHYLPAVIVCLLAVFASVAIGLLDTRNRQTEERGDVTIQLSTVRARIEGRLKATFNSTDGLINLVSLQGGIDRHQFEGLAAQALSKNPVIRNIALAPQDQVSQVYPLAGNEKVIGFRYSENAEQYRTVVEARRRGTPLLAGSVQLVQGGRALIQRSPVFSHRSPSSPPEYWGLVSIVAHVDKLLDLEGEPASRGLQIALRGQDGNGADGNLIAGPAEVFHSTPVLMEIEIPGGIWQIGAIPQGGWQQPAFYTSRYFLLGLFITFILTWLVGLRAQLNRQIALRNRQLEAEVEERQRIEMELREEEARFRNLFEHAPDPIWIIEGCRFTRCNQAAARLFGLTQDLANSFVHPAHLSPPQQPDGRPSLEKAEAMILVAQEKGMHRFEWMHQRPDGSLFPAEVTLVALQKRGETLLHATIQDISERKAREESMRLYANLFEQSSEAILITDRDNRIIQTNRALEVITGYSFAELKGRNPHYLASGLTSPETYQRLWHSLKEGGNWQGELWDRRKDGSLYPQWTTISAIRDEAGQVTHYTALFTDITERKEAEERMHFLAHHDKLTGLCNRHSLYDRLEQALATAERLHTPLAVLFIDMDRFKSINDTFGHHVGDLLLIEIGERLKKNVRNSDIAARLGGDEFVIVLTTLEASADAVPVANKILDVLAEDYELEDYTLHSTPSIGISLYPDHLEGEPVKDASKDKQRERAIEMLLKRADTAMYHAKAQGRNNCQLFSPDLLGKPVHPRQPRH